MWRGGACVTRGVCFNTSLFGPVNSLLIRSVINELAFANNVAGLTADVEETDERGATGGSDGAIGAVGTTGEGDDVAVIGELGFVSTAVLWTVFTSVAAISEGVSRMPPRPTV